MDTAKLHFIADEYIPLIKALAPDTPAKWGKMNVQQMVEHVSGFFKVSTEKIKFPVVSTEEHLVKLKEFLLSDKQFRENTIAPADIVPTEPYPVHYATLPEAIDGLQRQINDFVQLFENEPGKITSHPIFGPLNFEEWVLLHYKHVTHHLRQFGGM